MVLQMCTVRTPEALMHGHSISEAGFERVLLPGWSFLFSDSLYYHENAPVAVHFIVTVFSGV